jgi:peptide/nickel transport system ATP-binding protein
MVDASLRAMILDIMIRLRDEHNISFLYITHDLSTAYQIGDEIYMLYQGTITETGNTIKVIESPKHPYVQELIGSIPVPDPAQKWDANIALPDDEQLRAKVDSGCRFYPRCVHGQDHCLERLPPLYEIDGADHQAACYLYSDRPVATPEARKTTV